MHYVTLLTNPQQRAIRQQTHLLLQSLCGQRRSNSMDHVADHTVLLDPGHDRDLLQREPFLGGPATGGSRCPSGLLGDPHLVCWGAVQEEGQPDGHVIAPYLWFPVPGLQVSVTMQFTAYT